MQSVHPREHSPDIRVARESLIDLTELRKLSGETAANDSQEFVCEVIELFLALGPESYAIARSACEAGDAQSLARAVHKLQTQAAYFGARRVVQVCRQLEQLGFRGQLTRCEPLLDQLEDELDRVVVALEPHRASRG
jgi:HPt (histidine-containing phosphotransfer) domain-containing protein